jgi:hypothetical protein
MLLKDSRKPSQTTKRLTKERAPLSSIPVLLPLLHLFLPQVAAAVPAASVLSAEPAFETCGNFWEGLRALKANESKFELEYQLLSVHTFSHFLSHKCLIFYQKSSK